MSSPVRVLIVDDDAPFRRLLRLVLALPDLEIVGEAADGAMAVEAAQQLMPDLVLMDYSMPFMNGLDAAREIAKAPGSPTIMLLTSDVSPELCAKAKRVGVREVLSKGLSINALAKAVQGAAGIGGMLERAA